MRAGLFPFLEASTTPGKTVFSLRERCRMWEMGVVLLEVVGRFRRVLDILNRKILRKFARDDFVTG